MTRCLGSEKTIILRSTYQNKKGTNLKFFLECVVTTDTNSWSYEPLPQIPLLRLALLCPWLLLRGILSQRALTEDSDYTSHRARLTGFVQNGIVVRHIASHRSSIHRNTHVSHRKARIPLITAWFVHLKTLVEVSSRLSLTYTITEIITENSSLKSPKISVLSKPLFQLCCNLHRLRGIRTMSCFPLHFLQTGEHPSFAQLTPRVFNSIMFTS
jgi:hypothetical protein